MPGSTDASMLYPNMDTGRVINSQPKESKPQTGEVNNDTTPNSVFYSQYDDTKDGVINHREDSSAKGFIDSKYSEQTVEENVLKKLGNETTSLWVNNKEITIKCDQLTDMLDKLEVYALNCFDITSKHKRNVYQLSTIEEIENYDYTSGYPEKLTFTYE